MKGISDNDLDRLFKLKSDNFDYQFEEDAWERMEKKLRKRDRFIVLRNTSLCLFFLLFAGTGLYLYQSMEKEAASVKLLTIKPEKDYVLQKSLKSPHKSQIKKTGLSQDKKTTLAISGREAVSESNNQRSDTKLLRSSGSLSRQPLASYRSTSNKFERKEMEDLQYALRMEPDFSKDTDQQLVLPEKNDLTSDTTTPFHIRKRFFRTPKLSLTLSAGPDFNSIESIAGKNGTLNSGLLVNLTFEKFSLSTGAKYGVKVYEAENYDYQSSSSRAKFISGIDASCNVLEIPLQMSYEVPWGKKRHLLLSTGLSSYLMLKEKYLFYYTPESGFKDYLLQKKNENRAFFSLVTLSANYRFKVLNPKLLMGVEPYVKLPLGGVGEGKVRLKSSGIALNVTYDIFEKN